MMLRETTCIVNLYILEGHEFASRDIASDSDPYLVISCGTAFELNDRNNY
jgi:hypothetical protein